MKKKGKNSRCKKYFLSHFFFCRCSATCTFFRLYVMLSALCDERTSSTSSSSFSIFMQHFSLEIFSGGLLFSPFSIERERCDDNMFRCCKMKPSEFFCLLPIARLSSNFSLFFSFCSLSAVSRLNFHRQRMNDVSWKSFLSLHLHWTLRVCDENRWLFSSSLVSTFLLLMMMTKTSSLRLCPRWRIRVMITWSIGRRTWWWVCGLEKWENQSQL